MGHPAKSAPGYLLAIICFWMMIRLVGVGAATAQRAYYFQQLKVETTSCDATKITNNLQDQVILADEGLPQMRRNPWQGYQDLMEFLEEDDSLDKSRVQFHCCEINKFLRRVFQGQAAEDAENLPKGFEKVLSGS